MDTDDVVLLPGYLGFAQEVDQGFTFDDLKETTRILLVVQVLFNELQDTVIVVFEVELLNLFMQVG